MVMLIMEMVTTFMMFTVFTPIMFLRNTLLIQCR